MVDTVGVVVLWVALEPTTPADAQRLDLALERLAAEDLNLRVRPGDAGQIIVAGVDESHLEDVIGRLAREFHVAASVGKPQVAYKEAITATGEGEGRFVRRTVGRGQYGHVVLRVSPLPKGSGYHFSNETDEAIVPRRFVGAIVDGIEHALARSVIAACPIDDVEVELIGGSYHDTDSSETAFKIAAALAFADAAKKARPILLEPVMRIEARVPAQHAEELAADLQRRGATMLEREADGEMRVLRACAPLRQLFGYRAHLNYVTSGRATQVMQFDHYEPVAPESSSGADTTGGAVPQPSPPTRRGPGTAIPEPNAQ